MKSKSKINFKRELALAEMFLMSLSSSLYYISSRVVMITWSYGEKHAQNSAETVGFNNTFTPEI